MKSIGLNAKKGNKAKISLNKDGAIPFKTGDNANTFKNPYSELATTLMEQLPIAPNKFNSGTTKDYCIGISNNKRKQLSFT